MNIFMSGHKGNPKIEAFIKSINGTVLWKPFELYQLTEAIRNVEIRAKE